MNNVIDAYLTFKVDNVLEYIKILSDEMRVSSKIPRSLNKLIYKYYDLFVLSNKEVDYEKLKLKTGLDDTNARLILFYLLIEFDITSKTELSSKSLYEFYNFIVNSIIIFVDLEKDISKSKELYSYDNSIEQILKKHSLYLDADFLLIFDKLYFSLSKQYNKNQKQEEKIKLLLNSDTFKITLSKLKNVDGLFYCKFKHVNDKLEEESKKDVELIKSEYTVQMNFINIELVAFRILEEAFAENDKTIFIYLEDDVITKKVNFTKLVNLLNLRVFKDKINLIINTSVLEKYEDRVHYLIEEGFNISFKKDTELIKKNIYKQGGYMFVNYESLLEDEKRFALDNNLKLVVMLKSRISKEKLVELDDVMYFV